jgi:membrane protein DedA with SNARE-associated domain
MEAIISEWGLVTYGALFAAVLAEFVGIPIPSSMVLIASGGLAAGGHLSVSGVVILAMAAATIGDSFWFVIGRMKGEALLNGYCRLSLGSRDCVRRTRELFLRYPRTSLLLGKFIPGVATFVVPVAAFSGTPWGQFLKFDSAGIFLWASSMITIGYVAGEWIQNHAGDAERLNWSTLALLLGILVCFYAVKLWRRMKFGTGALIESERESPAMRVRA